MSDSGVERYFFQKKSVIVMPKKRVLLRKTDKLAVFWMLVMLLLFCSYKLYLYHTESAQTMTGQSYTPQSFFATLAAWMEE